MPVHHLPGRARPAALAAACAALLAAAAAWLGRALARRAAAQERMMAGLSPEQREAVILKIYQGWKFEEMAEALDCPVSTIKSRLYTALDRLKEILAPVRSSES